MSEEEQGTDTTSHSEAPAQASASATGPGALNAGRPGWQKALIVIVAIFAVSGALFIWVLSAQGSRVSSPMMGSDEDLGIASEQPDTATQSGGKARTSTAQLSSEFAARFGQGDNAGDEPAGTIEQRRANASIQDNEQAAAQSAEDLEATERASAGFVGESSPRFSAASFPPPSAPDAVDIKEAVGDALEGTETSARIIRIEEQVMGMSDRMIDMQRSLDKLVGLAETNLEATRENSMHAMMAEEGRNVTHGSTGDMERAKVEDKGGNENEEEGGDQSETDARPMPEAVAPDAVAPQAPPRKTQNASPAKVAANDGGTAIRGISIERLGENRARVDFSLSGDRSSRARLIRSSEVSWAKHKNWVSLDVFGATFDTSLPGASGIVRDVSYGAHDGFRRFVFTTGGTLRSANLSKSAGTISLTIESDPASQPSRARSYGSSSSTSTRKTASTTRESAHSRREVPWVVRAIADDAAVIYDIYSNQLVSVRRGSSVPQFGVVTDFSTAERTVYTTLGQISSTGSRFN